MFCCMILQFFSEVHVVLSHTFNSQQMKVIISNFMQML